VPFSPSRRVRCLADYVAMPGPTDEARVDYVLSEIVPGFQLIPTWVGLWVPKGTPDAIIKRLQRAITTINSDPSFITTLTGAGVEPRLLMGAQMAAAIRRKLELTQRLVKARNITLD